jgi:hypothetical protein
MQKWIPEKDPKILRRVGKTGEEASELAKVCCRIVIQGIEGFDPETRVSNKDALIMEIADVFAQCELMIEQFELSLDEIKARIDEKRKQAEMWEDMFL